MLCSHALTKSKDLLAWLNTNTYSLMKQSRNITSLWSGEAYLRLLSTLSPSDSIEGMIVDPIGHFEAAHNFRIIQAILLKQGMEALLNITKLTDGSQWHHIRLLSFIHDTFILDKHGSTIDSESIALPKGEAPPFSIKKQDMAVTDEEISNALERRHAKGEESRYRLIDETMVKLSNHIRTCKCENDVIPSQSNTISDLFSPLGVKQEIILKEQICTRQFNIQLDKLAKRQIVNLKNQRYNQMQKMSIIKSLNHAVIKFIKKIDSNQVHKFKSFVKINKSIAELNSQLLQYLFVGNIMGNCLKGQDYRKTALITRQIMKARAQIENMFYAYSRSFKFILNIISQDNSIQFPSLICLIKLLPSIELLPKIRWSFDQFFNLKYHNSYPYRISENYEQNLREEDPFWSDYKIVLISFEAKYILEKKIQNRMKYKLDEGKKCKGFLLKEAVVQDQAAFQQRLQKYGHLSKLLRDRNSQQLRQFVIGLLQFKHPLIIGYFLHTYNIIVTRIINVRLRQVYHHADRSRIIDQITQQLLECGKGIDSFLAEECGFAANLEGTIRLLRVTVYCFLAEMHSFTYNQFYYEAFIFSQKLERDQADVKSVDEQVQDDQIQY